MNKVTPAVSFTPLVEPTSNVTPNPPAAPFDVAKAYLLGQCCSLTYAQFDQGSISISDFVSLIYQGYSVSASNLQGFTVSEANEPGPNPGDVGDYYQAQAGFGVQLTLTPNNNGSAENIIVIALRGTRTWTEWFDDAEAIPVPFAGALSLLNAGLGSVHGGFYGLYTIGTNGATAATGQELSPTVSQRAGGSIAAQVGAYLNGLTQQLPVYVTGHSLGGALATLCALDVAYNFPSKFAEIFMYSLASPRVAAGLSDSFGVPIPTLGNPEMFVGYYQSYVPNSYRIVHAADIIPILPPQSTTLGPLTLTCAHVTDQYLLVGSGATATASIQDGAVTSIQVTNQGSGYSRESTLPVYISGGGGAGALAQGSTDLFETVSVKVLYGGSGYTSAPNVALPSSG